MRAEVFQLLHRVEHLRAKTSSHGSSSSSKGSFVSKMTHCGDHRQGHSVSWDTPASDMQCILRDVWKRVKDSGIFPRSYKSLVVNDNTCHEQSTASSLLSILIMLYKCISYTHPSDKLAHTNMRRRWNLPVIVVLAEELTLMVTYLLTTPLSLKSLCRMEIKSCSLFAKEP